MQKNDNTNAVIYARFSSSNQREESIVGQIRDCTEYAKRKGYTIINTYSDEALTGRSDKRPAFQQMIRDAENGNFSIILIWKTDRFARNRYDTALYKNKLAKNGVRVVSVMENISEGAEGIILESILEGYAEYYSANLSENVRRGNRESALELKTLGVRIYGYNKSADDHFEINAEQAVIVQRIFNEYASGTSTKEIVNNLNHDGIRSSTGKLWNINTLVRMLHNERYTGTYIFGDYRKENAMPQIIDKNLFEKVQYKMKLHKRAPNSKIADYMLTGKLFCGYCECAMVGEYGTSAAGDKYYYYVCAGHKKNSGCKKKRIKKDIIENLILGELMDIANDEDLCNRIADRIIHEQEERIKNDVEMQMMNNTIRDTIKRRDNVMRAIENGSNSITLANRLDELEQNIVELKDKKQCMLFERADVLTKEVILDHLRSFRDGNIKSPRFQKSLIDLFLNSAYIYDDHVIVNSNLVPENKKIELSEVLNTLNSSNSSQMADASCCYSNIAIIIDNIMISNLILSI